MTQQTPQSPQSLTRQQVYDRIIEGVRDGTLPGYDAQKGVCVYNHSAGRHCVIGLFGADLGLPLVENRAITEQRAEILTRLEEYVGLPWYELDWLQQLHDGLAKRTAGWSRWEFLHGLNQLTCFGGCQLVEPDQFAS